VNIDHCGFFVLRTPLLPFDEALEWGRSLACAGTWREDNDAETTKLAFQNDLTVLRTRLRRLLQRPEVMQALAVASPSLQAGIAIWNNDPECKKGIQAERSLVRYFMRMAGRATPFGLFSGCSVGSMRSDAPTELTLAPRHSYRTATRLDFDYLFALTSELRRNRDLQLEMQYGWNSSLCAIADGWHYVESRIAGTSRSHHLVKIANDKYLQCILAYAKPGHRGFFELANAIRFCDESESLMDEEIKDYIHELIDSDILVPDILPLLTGRSALEDLLDQLSAFPSAHNLRATLASVQASLFSFDCRPFGVTADDYESIGKELDALPAKVERARLLQVDMFKPVKHANLSQDILSEIYETLDILASVATIEEPSDLKRFRDAFTARYEQEWVSLTEALDLEVGIGYGRMPSSDGSPLLKELQITDLQSSSGLNLNEFQLFLLQKVLDCSVAGKSELELQMADFSKKNNLDHVLPESFAVMASLVASSAESLKRGDFELIFKGGVGPSCARMLGRFCSADRDLEMLVRSALREEEAQDPDAVYAEIVYLPEGRIGNILCRPVLRDYEITHLGRSGAPSNRQLAADDLLVSVRGAEIVLFSKTLRRRVIPRMSSAHGYNRASLSAIYRFLCDLQSQGGFQVPNFNWGGLAKLKTLPRVRIGRVILACAQWRISGSERKLLCDLDRYAAFVKLKEMQRELGLPRWVLLSEHDNTLPVDLENPLSVDSFLHLLKRTPEATLVEMYPQPNRQCVSGPEGGYLHELLIPLSRKRSAPQADAATSSQLSGFLRDATIGCSVQHASRVFPPESDWKFIKVYGGTSSLDDILVRELGPLLFSLSASREISRWFFVRYSDPEPHLRLRLQMSDGNASSSLTNALKVLFSGKRTWKIQIDTYRREIERYGGLQATLRSEDIFCADSDAVLSILQTLEGDHGLDIRWKIALLGIDALLTDFGLNLKDKLRLMERLRESFASEFQLSAPGKLKMSERFRTERMQLQALVRGELNINGGDFQAAVRAFARRSELTKPAVAALHVLEQKGLLANDLLELISSYIHMHVNRIIRASARAHELVLYDFLYRLYDSELARKRGQQSEDAMKVI
jgi:thiopeptide-type bacteriocin biosynthesis protein